MSSPTIRVVRSAPGPDSAGPLGPLWAALWCILALLATRGRAAMGEPIVWVLVGALAGPGLYVRVAPWLKATTWGFLGARPTPDTVVPWVLVLVLSVVVGERFVRSRPPTSRVSHTGMRDPAVRQQ